MESGVGDGGMEASEPPFPAEEGTSKHNKSGGINRTSASSFCLFHCFADQGLKEEATTLSLEERDLFMSAEKSLVPSFAPTSQRGGHWQLEEGNQRLLDWLCLSSGQLPKTLPTLQFQSLYIYLIISHILVF